MRLRLLVLLLLAGGGIPAGSAAQSPPNIVLIVADDLGWNDVGYHGSEIRTPNIDRLSREGVRLERFYVTPICSPTRSGLLTGRSPIRYGRMRAVLPPWRRMGLPLDERLLPEYLADLGYARRAAVGKWHLGHFDVAYHPLRRGFTQFYGHYNGNTDYFTHIREGELDWHEGLDANHDEGYATDLLTRRAVRFIDEHTGPQPFFLYLAYNAPHTPLQAPEDALALYPGLSEPRKTFAAMVTRMDEGIGRVLAALERNGIAENTLIWFMSDNGGSLPDGADNTPLRSGKQHTYEGGIRVPAVVRWPAGIRGVRTVGQAVAYTDVLPTLVAAAGADPQAVQAEGKPFDGIDVLGALRGSGSLPERDIGMYWHQTGPTERLALIRGPWKLIYYGPGLLEAGDSPDPNVHQISLFDLDSDLSEKHDLGSAHPDRVARMLAALKTFRRLQPADGLPPYDEGREGFIPPPDWNIELYPKDW